MFKTIALDSVANEYVDKNVGTSTPGTRLEADDRNILQDEPVNAVEASGQTLDPTGAKRSQIAQAMFLNGVGAQSLVDSGTANAKVLVPVTGASGFVFGESYALLTGAAFMFKNLVTNTGATTVNVGQTAGTLLGVKSLTQAGGIAFVGGELVAGKYYLTTYDLANDRFELVTFESFSVLRGHIDGLIMSNGTDTAHDIDISVGEAADSAGDYLMKLTAVMTKQIDAAWAVGTNAGGMFTGTVANDTWYHLFEIRKDSDGSIDFGFDTSLTASNKPAGYSNYRRIGAVLTDGSANIYQFIQIGDWFIWVDPIADYTLVGTGTAENTAIIRTPLGVASLASLMINTNGAFHVYVRHPDTTDLAATPGSAPYPSVVTANNQAIRTFAHTNTSSQVKYRVNANATLNLLTRYYTDKRGKDL